MVESFITNKNLIEGRLQFDKDSNVKIDHVDIMLENINVPIIVLTDFVKTDNSASFSYLIDTRARVGNYTVIWIITISGKETKIFDSFAIDDDSIDRTLPLELQHLR